MLDVREEQESKLERRVVATAEAALQQDKFVSPINVLVRLGWLPPTRVDEWRQGRIEHLAQAAAVRPDRLADALVLLHRWVERTGLRPSETAYLAATRDRRTLRFTADGDPATEQSFRTHWVSPELPEARREALARRQSKAPDLVVVTPLKEWTCATCDGTGDFLIMEDPGPVCMTCADMDHLTFLPAGDAALSRRAKKESVLSAVVIRFNRSRKRYERQGILVEEAALERAEEQCLADEDLRQRRRDRDRERRASGDLVFQAELATEIRRMYPGCPAQRAEAIARHAGSRGSGRVGRSAAGRALDQDAIKLAVIASVRHENTGYDRLLMSGVPRADARERIRADIDRVLASWLHRS
jgi:hypothetical protein